MVRDAVLHAITTEPSEKRTKDDAKLLDFDGSYYMVEYIKEAEGVVEHIVRVSLACKYVAAMKGKGQGLEELIQEAYGDLSVAPSEPYQLALQFDIDNIQGDKEAFAQKIAALKRHAVGAPMWQQFKALANGSIKPAPPIKVQNRPQDGYYIIPCADKVIVSTCMHFVNEDERIVGYTILKGFNYEHKSAQGSPNIKFTEDMPQELQAIGATSENGDWLTVTVFNTHVNTEAKLFNAVAQIQNLRAFVSLHAKAAKSYMASKMRRSIGHFEKVLERAQPTKDAAKGVPALMAVGHSGKLVEEKVKKSR